MTVLVGQRNAVTATAASALAFVAAVSTRRTNSAAGERTIAAAAAAISAAAIRARAGHGRIAAIVASAPNPSTARSVAGGAATRAPGKNRLGDQHDGHKGGSGQKEGFGGKGGVCRSGSACGRGEIHFQALA